MKVAVIGAGPAGLAFTDKLLELRKDISIDIYEKSNYIGGISKTVNYKGNRIDIGGHRFFSKSDEVMKWWTNKFPIDTSTLKDSDLISYQNANRNIEGFRTIRDKNINDNRIMLVRKRKSRILYSGKLYDYPLKLNLKTIKNIGTIKLIKVGLSYLKSKLNKNESKNLEEFIISRFGYKLYTMFFESYTEKVWGRHPKEISPEWGAQRIKGLSIRKVIIDIIQKFLPEKYQIQKNSSDNLPSSVKQQSYLSDLYPLFLILFYITVGSVITSWNDPVDNFMMDFMGLFFIVFSFFKFLDYKNFPNSFSMYDPLAKNLPIYGWVYPFIETALGLMFLFRIQIFLSLFLTVIFLSVTTAGVIKVLSNKEEVQCACLGTAIKLPMTIATLIENSIMIVMAIVFQAMIVMKIVEGWLF